jgi:hypothetical protein
VFIYSIASSRLSVDGYAVIGDSRRNLRGERNDETLFIANRGRRADGGRHSGRPGRGVDIQQRLHRPSWSADPSALAAAEIAVPAAEQILSGLFTNPGTVTISFIADPTISGAYDSPYGYSANYNDVAALLTNHSSAHPENTALASSVANLPGAAPPCPTCQDPSNPFFVPQAEYLALTGAPTFPGDTIGIGTQTTWDPNQSNGITPGEGDLTGVMLHEITHDLGRVDYAFDGLPVLTPMNLDRYGCGTTSLTTSANNACFSIDGDATDVNQFSPTSDTGDWLTPGFTPTGDAFNAFFYYGQLLTLSAGDITEMNALGWEPPYELGSGTVHVGAVWAGVRRSWPDPAPAAADRLDLTL